MFLLITTLFRTEGYAYSMNSQHELDQKKLKRSIFQENIKSKYWFGKKTKNLNEGLTLK